MPALLPADTRGLLLVHRALRRELARLERDLEVPPAPDRAGALRQRYAVVAQVLAAHQDAEEQHLGPVLSRVRPDLSQELRTVVVEHEELQALDAACREELTGPAVGALRRRLDAHIRREEDRFLPVWLAALDDAERKRIAAAVDAATTAGSDGWSLALAAVAAPEVERAALLRAVPAGDRARLALRWAPRYRKVFGA